MGTPNYNIANNTRKAVYSLNGILQGLVADQRLNESELLFLDTWLRSQEHLRQDPDCIDLLDAVSDVLKDGIITSDEFDDLCNLIQDIIEFKVVTKEKDSDLINECLGIISGIVADDDLKEDELAYLFEWIGNHPELSESYPINVIVESLLPFLENHITPEDSASLLTLFKQITGNNFTDTGSADAHPLDFIADQITHLNHEHARICFTGTFNKGSRSEIEALAKSLGAITRKDPSKSIDYVIIGSQVSPNWISSSYGRKIQKAVELKRSGHPLIILTEHQWIKFL